MSTEFEAAGLGSAGALGSRTKADLTGQPCRNCGKLVPERHCPNCGQLAASFHRPVFTLVSEIVGDLTSLDGRLGRTLPRLFFRPGRLTKDYTSGQRARFVPPFRLFLLTSVIFYFVLFGVIERAGWLTGEQLADPETGQISITVEGGEQVLIDEDGRVDRELALRALTEGDVSEADIEEADEFINRVATVIENRELFRAQMEQWLPRLSFLALPITIFALVLLHFWRRSLYVYDHAIHALHLQSWIYLTGSVLLILSHLIGGTGWTVFSVALFIYVWRSLVVATDTNALMGFLRLLCLLVIWTVLAVTIVLGGAFISSRLL
ncbi:MAG: DUF3667 domain-containing protein [Pseudomonadota bacterium]